MRGGDPGIGRRDPASMETIEPGPQKGSGFSESHAERHARCPTEKEGKPGDEGVVTSGGVPKSLSSGGSTAPLTKALSRFDSGWGGSSAMLGRN